MIESADRLHAPVVTDVQREVEVVGKATTSETPDDSREFRNQNAILAAPASKPAEIRGLPLVIKPMRPDIRDNRRRQQVDTRIARFQPLPQICSRDIFVDGL